MKKIARERPGGNDGLLDGLNGAGRKTLLKHARAHGVTPDVLYRRLELAAEFGTSVDGGDIARSDPLEAVRARKKETDRDHGKLTGQRRNMARVRARLPKRPHPDHPDHHARDILDPAEVYKRPSVPLAETADGEYIEPDAQHARLLQELRDFLAVHAKPREADGRVMRLDQKRVRAAYVAVFGAQYLDENEWERRLRGAFCAVLMAHLGETRLIPWAPDARGTSDGATLLSWLGDRCEHVPAALTASLIDEALKTATLGRGGRRKKNWETAVAEIVDALRSPTPPNK